MFLSQADIPERRFKISTEIIGLCTTTSNTSIEEKHILIVFRIVRKQKFTKLNLGDLVPKKLNPVKSIFILKWLYIKLV